jgi:hypothetical protein
MGRRRDELQAISALAQQFGGPLVAQVRNWKGDPANQLRRQANKADRKRTRWAYTSAGCAGLAMVLALSDGVGIAFAVFVMLAILSAVTSVRAHVALTDLRKQQAALPAAPAVPSSALPAKNSRGYEPMRRLAGAEASLTDLLSQLEQDSRSGSVPPDSVAQARATGAEAAAALRAVAGRLITLESALQHTSPANRAELSVSVRELRSQLDAGLDGYGELIAAAGRVVAAGTPAPTHREVLTNATDHLAGLAAALRDLSAR